jgi:hypothetical protein
MGALHQTNPASTSAGIPTSGCEQPPAVLGRRLPEDVSASW